MLAFVVAFLPAIDAQAQELTVPSAPQDVVAAAEDGGVVLRWSAPADNGGSSILRYEMRRAEGASVPEEAIWISTGSRTSGAFRRLTNGTLYSFEVRAVNAQGDGPAVLIRATPGFPPSAPRNLTATPRHGGIALRWQAPADRGSTAITRYEYRYAEGGMVPSGTAWTVDHLNDRFVGIDDLTNGTAYTFEVRAVNAVGRGDAATVTAAPVRHPTITVRPEQATYRLAEGASGTGVAIVAQGEQGASRPNAAIRVSVNSKSVEDGAKSNADFDSLSLIVAISPEDFTAVGGIWQARKTVALSIVDDALAEDDEDLTVVLAPAQGSPSWLRFRDTVVTVTIEDNDRVPSPPQNLAATSGEDKVTLDWEAPADKGTSEITRYEYRYAEGASVREDASWTSVGTALTATIGSLTEGTAYAFEVRAVSPAGEGEAASATGSPLTLPSVPRDVVVTAEDGGIVLNWSAPADKGGSAILRYEIRHAEGASVLADTPWISTGSRTSGAFRRLTNETLYSFEVRAVNAQGDGPAALIQATPGLPTAPRNVRVTAEDGGIVLRWSAPGSNGGSAIRYYEIRHAEGASVPAGTAWISTGTRTSGAFRRLTNGTLYSFEVRAVSIRGEGKAAQIQARPGLLPSAPQNLTATPRHGGVTLRWQAPADRGSTAITRYEYRYAAGTTVPSGTAWQSGEGNLIEVISHLTNGTAYAFEVRAVNASGGGTAAMVTAAPVAHPTVTLRLEQATYRFAEGASGAGVVVVARGEAGGDRPSADFYATVSTKEVRNGADSPGDYRAVSTTLTFIPAEFTAVDGIWETRKTVALSIVDDALDEDDENLTVELAPVPGSPSWLRYRDTDVTVTIEDNDRVPSPPQNLTATRGEEQVELEWQAPADKGTSEITRYEYRYAEGASVPEETAWTSAGTRRTKTIGSLSDTTEYAFEVRAVSPAGEGEAARARARLITVPSVPTNVRATNVNGQLGLQWSAPEHDGGSNFVKYEFRYARGSSVPGNTGWLSKGANTRAGLSGSGVIHGEEYSFEVRARNEAGPGPAAKVTITAATAPDVVRELRTRPGNGKVTLRWLPPVDDGGFPVIAYLYRYGPGATVPESAQVEALDAVGTSGTFQTVTIEGLTNGTQYTFEVSAFTTAGTSEPATVRARPRVVPPSAPQSFSATPGDGQVKLTWAAPADDGGAAIDRYEYRHAEGSSVPETTSWTSAGTDLTVTVSGLTNDTEHAFEVRAVNSAGEGDAAALTAAPAAQVTAPGVPRRFSTTPGDGQVKLTWEVPASDGGAAIDRYEYRHAEGSSVPETTSWISVGTALTVTLGNLTNDTEHAFEVRAVNSVGEGDAAALTATPAAQATAPDAPRSLAAEPGDGQVKLTWEVPASDGGAAIERYEYRHAAGASVPETTNWNSAGTAQTVTVGSLTNGAEYAFEVRAVSVAGAGDAAVLTATPATVPGAPRNFSTTPSDGQVKLTWTAPASDGGAAIERYEYRHAAGASVPATTSWVSVGTDLTVTVGSLTNDTKYAFEVRAVSAAGEGEIAAVTATPAVSAVAPSAPQSLAAEPGDGQVKLTWEVPASDGGAAIERYEYRHAEGDSVPETTSWTSAGTALTVTVSGLTNDTEHAFEVRAVSAAGEGGIAAITATPAVPAVAPSAPQSLEAEVGDGQVKLTWAAPSEPGTSAVDRYEYRHAEGSSVPATTSWTSAGTALTVTVSSLTNDTEHAFEVRAVSDAGEGEIAAITATPAVPAVAPSAPQSLEAEVGDGQVKLTWAAPSDPGSSAIESYEYRHATGNSVPTTAGWTSAGNVLTVTVSGLTNDTEHAFEVRAVSAAGEGDIAAITATPVVAPSAPQSLEAEPGDGHVKLTWAAPSEPGSSAIDRYEYRHAEGDSVPETTSWTSAGTDLTVTVSGLTNDTEHAFEVRAVSDAGEGEIAAITATPAVPAVAPSAPQSLAAEPGDGQVKLTWAAPSEPGTSAIERYEYRHAEGSSVPTTTSWTSVGTALTVTVSGLTNDTEHAFEVRAVSAAGEGEIAAITATPAVPAVAPSAPQSLAAEAGDGQVKLTWAAPSEPGTSAIERYEYRHAEGSSVPETTVWTSAGDVLTVTVSGLTNDTEHAFEVRAVSDAGEGEIAAITATPVAPAVAPSAPQSLEAEAGDGQVKLTWAAPSEPGSSAIDRYEYRHAEGSSVPTTTSWTSAGDVLTVTVSGLTNDTEHAFEVRAVSAAGEGDIAAITATPVAPAVAPSAPQSLEAEAGDGQVKLTWAAPSEPGTSAIERYEYRYAEGASVPTTTAWTSAGDVLTVTVSGLTNETEYAFEVRAVSAAGEGDIAALTATPVAPAVAPSAPQSLEAEAGDGQVKLTWAAPSEPGTSAIERYEYRHAEGSSVPETTVWTSAGDVLTVTVSGLTNDTEHAFEVRAVSAAGEGEIAAITSTPAAPAVAPSAPQSLTAEAGDGQVKLTWAAPSEAGTSAIERYEYRHAEGSSVPETTGWTSAGDVLTVTVSGLTNDTEHAFEVRAVSAAGEGEIAALTATPVAPVVAPSAPQSLEAEVGDSQVKLTWAAPSEPGTSAIERYEFRHAEGSSVPETTVWTSAGDVLTVTVSGLTNDTEHAFEVRAVSAAGEGEIAALTATPAVPAVSPLALQSPAVTRIEITPVPPEASADHGPHYPKNDFLAVPDDAVHGRGDTLTFTLTLDAEVTVTGTPELVLDIYDRERRARYTGGSGTTQLTFDWTVAKGDNDPDGLDVVSLDLNGGTVRDGDDRDLLPETIAAQHFPRHRVRGGLHAMRLEVSGSAREGEPFEIRLIRNGGYDEPAVAVVGVTDSALPHITQNSSPVLNGPGIRQFNFYDGEPSELGVRVSTRTVTPLGDGLADESRTLTVQLTFTDAAISRHTGQGIRAWYLAQEPLQVSVPVIDTGQPPAGGGLRVHDTSTTEAPGAKLVFRVTLSPRSDSPVTVDYRTGDDPHNEPKAVAGSDYVATDGTLTFDPGETEKTVEVEVLADDHNEQYETMRLILSNARGARIAKASARGIIKNDGPIPRAWITRFGRTVADQVLDAVESRVRTAREPGVEMTLAGQQVGGESGSGEQGPGGDPDAVARLSDWPQSEHVPLWGDDRHGQSHSLSRETTAHDLLSGTSFAVTAESGRGGYVSLWGRGAVTRFDGREGDLTLDGEVSSAMVGADWAREDWTAGLIVSRSDAEGGYEGHGSGRVVATLTGLYPWGRLALSDSVDAWGAAGYGAGELRVKPQDQPVLKSDLEMTLAAAGARGRLAGEENGPRLEVVTDGRWVQTTSARVSSPAGNLAAARTEATRLRLGLEGLWPLALDEGAPAGGATVTPRMKLALRHDGGDAETGYGIEIAGGVELAVPELGLTGSLDGRGVVAHQAAGLSERGIAGTLAWDPPPPNGRGPKLTLSQTFGAGGANDGTALFERETLEGIAANDNGDDLGRRRMEVRFGYGFAMLGGRFTGTPEVALGLSDTSRDYGLGWRFVREGSGPGSLELSLDARRRESVNDDLPPEHGIGLRLTARF